MFRSKTVFVLGAGASAEVGLPVGDTLLKQICDLIDIRYDHGRMTNGDANISQALSKYLDEGREVKKYNEYLHAAWQIVASSKQALSIDNIVDGLEDERIEKVAKIGIARAIHEAETNSAYFKPMREGMGELDFTRFNGSWYSDLTKIICENRRKSNLSLVFENLSFVSFNYDRCIEHYLPRSVSSYYGLEISIVLGLFEDVRIHRPYGIAGNVRYSSLGGVAEFGGGGIDYLLNSAESIRTFTEGVENPESLSSLRHDLEEADRIVFLGSAFHRHNLELLRSDIKPNAQIFATSGNISEPDLEVVEREMRDIFSLDRKEKKGRISFARMHCKEFFGTYWRTLTA